jgi:glycosyltransferase involved in cell wall biosynthesis
VGPSRTFAFIEHHPVFGGPHNRAVRLAAPLAALGWRTVAIVPAEPGSAQDRLRAAGVTTEALALHRLRRAPSSMLPLLASFPFDVARIRAVLRSANVDVVVVVGLENPHGAVAARLERLPIIWQITATHTPVAFTRAIMPLIVRWADVVMTTGRKIAAQQPGLLEGCRDRWVPFVSPVDVDLFTPDAGRRARARRELGLADDDVVIGTVGNRNPQKGHETFVRAAALLRRTHPDVRFVILGGRDENHAARDDAMWREAESLGLTMGRDLLVVDPGYRVSELAPALDIFWLSSVPRSEGVPTVIMEAMALGLPVVATDVGGVTDVVADGVTGFVVPALDPGALASETATLLDSDELRRRMGAAARTRAVAEFRTERCVETHVGAFELALAHGAARMARA